jgi:hypothetical protein
MPHGIQVRKASITAIIVRKQLPVYSRGQADPTNQRTVRTYKITGQDHSQCHNVPQTASTFALSRIRPACLFLILSSNRVSILPTTLFYSISTHTDQIGGGIVRDRPNTYAVKHTNERACMTRSYQEAYPNLKNNISAANRQSWSMCRNLILIKSNANPSIHRLSKSELE